MQALFGKTETFFHFIDFDLTHRHHSGPPYAASPTGAFGVSILTLPAFVVPFVGTVVVIVDNILSCCSLTER